MDMRIVAIAEAVLVAAILLVPATLALTGGGTRIEGEEVAVSAPAKSEVKRENQKRLRKAARIDGARVAAADSEPGNWLAHGRTYSEQRFSPLDAIDKETVTDLGVTWEFRTNTVRGLEASPIVSDGIMFVSGPWSVVWALDAKTGEQLWFYDPEVPGEWGRHACCDVVNRGVAVWKGAVYVATIDGRLIKIDADTGKAVWDINTIDRARPYTITGAPRIVDGKVIIGNGGAEYGVRGYVTAYEAKTGRQLWRFFTVPGDPKQPVEHPELDLAMKSWSDKGGAFKWWELGGGGTVWDSMAYDAELDLLYIGVGNGSPWNRHMRSPGGGDNLYVSSIVALRPDDGSMAWHYQTTPGDTWDFTATQHMVLADLEIAGQKRKVIMQAPKNGFFYVLDRETGALVSAEPYVAINWATGIDKATGRPIENPAAYYEHAPSIVIPAQVGGHNWQPMAFSPRTGLVYIPAIDAAAIYAVETPLAYKPMAWNTGFDFAAVTKAVLDAVASGNPPPPALGFIRAWDPVAQKERWSVPMTGAWNGGLLATAGGLVFGGGMDGVLGAYDAETGERLWSIDLKTGILAPPISYTVDGEQYVAVAAAWGGAWGLANLKDANAAAVKWGTNQGRIFAFKLGGKKDVEPIRVDHPALAEPPAQTADAATIEKGFALYARHCLVCHGFLAESTGVIPDLRVSRAEIWDSYDAIVLSGALKDNGMASFADQLSPPDVDAVRAYVLQQAHALYAAEKGAPN